MAIGNLSHGHRQLALIVRAMVNSPILLMLDKPFNGLDILKRDPLSEMIDHIGRHARTHLIFAIYDESEILPCMAHFLTIDK